MSLRDFTGPTHANLSTWVAAHPDLAGPWVALSAAPAPPPQPGDWPPHRIRVVSDESTMPPN